MAAREDTYGLTISFLGLTCFVRDQPRAGAITALLPNLWNFTSSRIPGYGAEDFCRHEPRLMYYGQGTVEVENLRDPVEAYSCEDDKDDRVWQMVNIYQRHIELAVATADDLDLAGLSNLPRIDHLAAPWATAPERRLLPNLTSPLHWPRIGRSPLLSSRVILNHGRAEVETWPTPHKFKYTDGEYSHIARKVVLQISGNGPLLVLLTDLSTSEVGVLRITGDRQPEIRFENNCPRTGPGTSCRSGDHDFVAHYSLLNRPQSLERVPFPEEENREDDNGLPPAGDAQCSPAEHGGG